MLFFAGHETDSASSTADFAHERAPLSRQKDQNKSLLDKLTQEKLDSKTKLGNKRNDLSSGRGQSHYSESNAPTSSLLCLCSLFLYFSYIFNTFSFLMYFKFMCLCTFVMTTCFILILWLIYIVVTLIYLTHSLCLENTLPF